MGYETPEVPTSSGSENEELARLRAEFWRWFRHEWKYVIVPSAIAGLGLALSLLSTRKDLPQNVEQFRPYLLSIILCLQASTTLFLLLSIPLGSRPMRLDEQARWPKDWAHKINKAANHFVVYWTFVWGAWFVMYTAWAAYESTSVVQRSKASHGHYSIDVVTDLDNLRAEVRGGDAWAPLRRQATALRSRLRTEKPSPRPTRVEVAARDSVPAPFSSATDLSWELTVPPAAPKGTARAAGDSLHLVAVFRDSALDSLPRDTLQAVGRSWRCYLDTTRTRADSAVYVHGRSQYVDTGEQRLPPGLAPGGRIVWRPMDVFPPRFVAGWHALSNLLSNLATLAIVMCFYCLAKLPSPPRKLRRPGPLVPGVAIVVGLFIVESTLALTGAAPESIRWFGWFTGVVSGTALALLVGRLQSRFFGPPTLLMVFLYTYAVIQSAWGSFPTDPGVELVLISLALIFKMMLFYLVYWTIRSGTLLYYFYRVRATETFKDGERGSEYRRRLFLERILPSEDRIEHEHEVALDMALVPASRAESIRAKSCGIVFEAGLAEYREFATPTSVAGHAHSYNIMVGPALCACLAKAAEGIYSTVTVLDALPAAGRFDVVLRFALQYSDLDVYFQEGRSSDVVRAVYALTVVMEAHHGVDLRQIGRTSISGSGFGARSATASTADRVLARAVESGIRQVCEGAALQLMSGFADDPKA